MRLYILSLLLAKFYFQLQVTGSSLWSRTKKKKKTTGWENLIKKLTNTTRLFEMKWRLERGEKGQQSGRHREAMFLAKPQA